MLQIVAVQAPHFRLTRVFLAHYDAVRGIGQLVHKDVGVSGDNELATLGSVHEQVAQAGQNVWMQGPSSGSSRHTSDGGSG